VKSLANIELCKDLSISDLGERFIDQGEGVLVFLGKAIELAIIYTEVQTAVRLGDKEHRRDERGAAWNNKPLVKVLKEVFFDYKELLSGYPVERAIA
jgi:hypothetical protein